MGVKWNWQIVPIIWAVKWESVTSFSEEPSVPWYNWFFYLSYDNNIRLFCNIFRIRPLLIKESNEMTLNNKNVYIVDDDESICRSLKTYLMTYDFEVKTFNSAESFFDAVPNDEPGYFYFCREAR